MGLGWLFGKKKVLPKVPFPEGQPFDENTFQFSKRFNGETVIEPEHLQAAAGYNQPFNLPESGSRTMSSSTSAPMPASNFNSEPLFVKVDAYQRILGEMDGLKSNLNKLQEVNRHLESSEYNEENNFEKLKKAMKMAHDKLLQVDKTLFKYQGE
ncbi:MAG: hypothetical protein WCV90_04045 [Candidatus Woesearchaeota archaeon]|jgi:hypothetical protein